MRIVLHFATVLLLLNTRSLLAQDFIDLIGNSGELEAELDIFDDLHPVYSIPHLEENTIYDLDLNTLCETYDLKVQLKSELVDIDCKDLNWVEKTLKSHAIEKRDADEVEGSGNGDEPNILEAPTIDNVEKDTDIKEGSDLAPINVENENQQPDENKEDNKETQESEHATNNENSSNITNGDETGPETKINLDLNESLVSELPTNEGTSKEAKESTNALERPTPKPTQYINANEVDNATVIAPVIPLENLPEVKPQEPNKNVTTDVKENQGEKPKKGRKAGHSVPKIVNATVTPEAEKVAQPEDSGNDTGKMVNEKNQPIRELAINNAVDEKENGTAGESTAGNTEQASSSKDTMILIVLFVAVVAIVGAAFGYNYYQRRKKNEADLEAARGREMQPMQKSARTAEQNSSPEMKPLMENNESSEQTREVKQNEESAHINGEKIPVTPTNSLALKPQENHRSETQ